MTQQAAIQQPAIQQSGHEIFGSSNQWAAYEHTVDRLIRDAMAGSGASESTTAATVSVNTSGMIDRVKDIAELLDIKAGDVVGDFGCGYGFMPILMGAVTNAKIDAFDRSDSFLDVGRAFIDAHPELAQGVGFTRFDYMIDSLPENAGPYDTIILNNTMQYVVGKENKREVIRRLSTLLKPGGSLMMFGPNQLYPREPFTRLMMVHWLPRKMSNSIALKRGRRMLSDIEYSTYPGLKRITKSAGLEKIKYYPNGQAHLRMSDGRRRAIVSPVFCNAFALVGKAPKPMACASEKH